MRDSRLELFGAAVLLLVPLMSSSAGPQQPRPLFVPNSAWTGQDFHDRGESAERDLYVNGLIDGFLGAPIFGGDIEIARALHECVLPMKISQVSAILAKYNDSHPETWHISMHVLANLALTQVCPSLSVAEGAFLQKLKP